MNIVSIRFAATGGGERFRLAEVLTIDADRPTPLHVRYLDNQSEGHVHPNSILWSVESAEATALVN